jgi:hypothetical protein
MLRHTLLLIGTITPSAGAQLDAYWEFRPMVGVAVPTGALRGTVGTTAFVGAQSSIHLTTALDLVASFGWQSSDTKYTVAERHANVAVYNAGLERLFRRGSAFVPFAGAGVGGRSYDFRSSSLESGACYAGYANAGAVLERGRTTARLEARENLFCYRRPFAPFDRVARNDVSLGAGIGLRF